MSSFTRASLFMPIVTGPSSGNWLSGQAFRFYESDDMDGPSIDIAVRDESNGADIPPAWAVFLGFAILSRLFVGLHTACLIGLFMAALVAWLLPKIHAEYIAAIFVHDIGLKKFRHVFSRRRIDKMFLKALRLERWALVKRPCLKLANFKALIVWMLRDVPHWFWRLVRPFLIFGGVSAWGVLKERQNYLKPVHAEGKNYV